MSKPDLPAFSAGIHAPIVFRAALMGLPLSVVADLIGVPDAVLTEWVEKEPSLRHALRDAAEADQKVLASLYYAAIGWDPYGDEPAERGPSTPAAVAWLKQRQNWQDRKEPPAPVEKLTTEQFADRLKSLERMLQGQKKALPVVDVKPGSDDAGF